MSREPTKSVKLGKVDVPAGTNLFCYCETKVLLILVLMITKQGLKLMIIFQV